MADLSSFYQTYNNAGSGVAYLDDNKKATNGIGVAGRTMLIKLSKSNMTQAELDTYVRLVQAGGTAGTDDAATIIGISSDGGDTPGAGNTDFVSGESDLVFFLVNTTGALTAGANYRGAGATMAVEAVFNQTDGVDTGLVMDPIA